MWISALKDLNDYMFFIFRFYKENNYDPIDYACIDEAKF